MIELIESSTIHGVSHIHSAKSQIIKLLWIFLFIFGIIGIFINIAFILIKYFSNPVLFSHILNHEPFIWPDMTFCKPTAPFYFGENSQAYNHWAEVVSKTKRIVERLANETKVFKIIIGKNNTDYELEERTIAMSSADPYKLKVDDFQSHVIGINFNKIQEGIYYNVDYSVKAVTSIDEDLKPLFTTQLVQIGNNIPCFTFHIDRSKFINQNSIKSVNFNLKFNLESYFLFNSSYLHRSVFLYISNRNSFPRRNEILLAPGFNNIISLSQSRYELKGVQRKCRNEKYVVELYDALLQSTSTFEGHYDDCKRVESQRLFVRNCNCYSPFLPIYKNKTGQPRICLNGTFYSEEEILQNAKCMVDVFRRFQSYKAFMNILHSNCEHYRFIKCKEVKYGIEKEKELFVEFWSGLTNQRRQRLIKKYSRHLTEKFDNKKYFERMRDNFIGIAIKRETQKGDLYKEEYEYPFSELLSDIGGLMGLWLGMSVVGLFEIFEFIYLYLVNLCGRTRKQQPILEKCEINPASPL